MNIFGDVLFFIFPSLTPNWELQTQTLKAIIANQEGIWEMVLLMTWL